MDYNQAINLDPKYAGTFNNRGVAYRSKGDFGRALVEEYSLPVIAHLPGGFLLEPLVE